MAPPRYNTDLFDDDTIARWLNCYATLLDGILERGDTSVLELPMFNEEERQRMFVDWNEEALEIPTETCIHHLFQNQDKNDYRHCWD